MDSVSAAFLWFFGALFGAALVGALIGCFTSFAIGMSIGLLIPGVLGASYAVIAANFGAFSVALWLLA